MLEFDMFTELRMFCERLTREYGVNIEYSEKIINGKILLEYHCKKPYVYFGCELSEKDVQNMFRHWKDEVYSEVKNENL